MLVHKGGKINNVHRKNMYRELCMGGGGGGGFRWMRTKNLSLGPGSRVGRNSVQNSS